MSTRTMYIVIITLAISMIGIGVIQYVWFKESVNQNEKNFDDKVQIALGIVKERLLEDAQETDVLMKKLDDFKKSKDRQKGLLNLNQYRTYKSILNQANSTIEAKKLNFELIGAELLVNPNAFLKRIDKEKLDAYLKHELNEQDITLDYDYGVYSTEQESFIIMNGNYTASIGATEQSTPVETGNDLFNTEYKISLFNAPTAFDEEAPGYLKIYFPTKTKELWSGVIPSLIMSILLSAMVLFCFGYVVWVIHRQKQISEMKTDFINNMTHEFKTPIATISLAADSINSPRIINEESKVKRFVGIIKQENTRMLNQVEKVLQMAMLDKKDFQLKKSEVDVHDIITTAAEHLDLKILKRNGILRTHLNAERHLINADATHLSNIIHNLLDNAEKYSDKTVEIDITTSNKDGGIVIEISDRGIGMTKDQVKNIFEKFYRAHTGNIHNVKGFGLGLSYVKAIVDAHEGTISVKSEQGKGSTFSVYLPQRA